MGEGTALPMKLLIALGFLLFLPATAFAAQELQEYTSCGCCHCCAHVLKNEAKNVCLYHAKGDSILAVIHKTGDKCKATHVVCKQHAGRPYQCNPPEIYYHYCDKSPLTTPKLDMLPRNN